MRILYFHQHFTTPAGAGGTRSFEMAKRLIARGHRVTMVCGSPTSGNTGVTEPFVGGRRRGVVEGIDIIEFALEYSNRDGFLKRTLLFLSYSLRSTWVGLFEPADIIFATTTPLTAGIPGIAARWLRGRPFIFEVRDLWPELPKAMGAIKNPIILTLMSALEWASYHSATRLVALSSGIAEGIARRGISQERIKTIPNGCDLDMFGGIEPWRPDIIPADAFLAVFTGTVGIANGLDAVVDAAAELKRRKRDDIKILIVGDGKQKPALEQLVSAQRLDNLYFHPPIAKLKVAGLLLSADIGLQILADVPAFYYGTSPNKFFDYIAAGMPVLTNYPGWVADFITGEKIGFAVRPRSPAAFADGLEKAANDRAGLKAMGARAKEAAKAKFSRDKLGGEFVSWLESGA